MKPRTKIFLGVFTSLLVITFIPIYDFFIKNKIDSVEVVVVKAGSEILPTEAITESNLSIERRRRQDLISEVVLASDIRDILGYDAAQLLVSNSMISRKMVDFDNLVPDESEGESIRPIISDMIYAMPGSLRRKDHIDIYTISSARLEEQNKSENKASSIKEEDVKLGVLGQPILTSVRVVYVKDSGNKEVTSADEVRTSEDERLNATGNISDLELILNEEDFQRLMDAVIGNEMKLYITYN
ncbi:hypothetical protein [Bacillus alkalicellulosilyticus]|uniref:hypothetical protein n=1 Tax=Alkalihalobacterium alkalicellulosilyticum TaxID=1912214 RepID=UPI000997C1A5|nr:hypothetical protein [Bacillus alkalicellulosilyticus]